MNKNYEHRNQAISLQKYRSKRLNKIRIVVTTPFLSEIRQPNGYTKKSSLYTYVLTYTNRKTQ